MGGTGVQQYQLHAVHADPAFRAGQHPGGLELPLGLAQFHDLGADLVGDDLRAGRQVGGETGVVQVVVGIDHRGDFPSRYGLADGAGVGARPARRAEGIERDHAFPALDENGPAGTVADGPEPLRQAFNLHVRFESQVRLGLVRGE